MVFITLMALIVMLFLAANYAMPSVTDWRIQRRDARIAAMKAEMQALLAAQRLSALAWQTRQEMHETMMTERRAQRSGS